MTDSILYVTYYVAPQQKSGFRQENREGMHSLFSLGSNSMVNKENSFTGAVQEFLKNQPQSEVIGSYTEIMENRKTAKWPELQKAINLCKERKATLLLTELGTLTSNESFTQLLLVANIPFYCIDQPFVNQVILEALSKHAKIQRKVHAELIREGLKQTSAKSGNPNAAVVISKVNKPKIDTAIVFAFLLQPIIQDYRRKGYSQRQMVKTLNEEGFTAPEGGKWVLSQLQKVLDRVRLNEIATELKTVVETLKEEKLMENEIAQTLNSKGIASLKGSSWDATQVKKLQDRIQQIEDIVYINRFVLHLLPLIHEYRERKLSSTDMLREFETMGMNIRHKESLVAQ